MEGTPVQVLLLCGPSGCGKTHVALRSGLPVVHLDDFYLGLDSPDLPVHPGLGVVDWDDPRSWDGTAAVGALERLCRDGRVSVPIYDMEASLPVGTREVRLGGAPAVVAEGVFAPELVGALRARGLLADAVVLRRPAPLNFVRRLTRDLRERRMAPAVLWRRGWLQMREEPAFVAAAVARGCRAVGARELDALLTPLRVGRGT